MSWFCIPSIRRKPEETRPIKLLTTDRFCRDFQYLTDGREWEILDFVVPGDPKNSSGHFGIVAKGRKTICSEKHRHTPHNCVLKIMRKFTVLDSEKLCGLLSHEEFRRELVIMQYVKDNIQGRSDLVTPKALVRIYDAWEYQNNGDSVEGVFVVEELRGGDLYSFVQKIRDDRRYISEDYLRTIMLPVFQALKVLHNHRIVHNDLKVENLVFRDTTHFQLVIVDFGLAYQMRWPGEEPIQVPQFHCNSEGKPFNFSPQQRDPLRQRNGTHISPANDIFAMGYTLNSILDGAGRQLSSSERYKSNHVRELINGMMQTDSKLRWDINQVLSSKWFACSREELIGPNSKFESKALIPISSEFSLGGQSYKQKISNLHVEMDKIKDTIIDHFASSLREVMWDLSIPAINAISVPVFKEILNDCSVLGRFQDLAAPCGNGTKEVETFFDIDNDGKISFHEVTIFLRVSRIFDLKQVSTFIFKLLDSDGDGKLTRNDISCALYSTNVSTDEQAGAREENMSPAIKPSSPRSLVSGSSILSNRSISSLLSYAGEDNFLEFDEFLKIVSKAESQKSIPFDENTVDLACNHLCGTLLMHIDARSSDLRQYTQAMDNEL